MEKSKLLDRCGAEGDYQSAVDAGIPFVYAAYGFGEVQDCAYEIQSIRELPEVLERVQ